MASEYVYVWVNARERKSVCEGERKERKKKKKRNKKRKESTDRRLDPKFIPFLSYFI